MVGPLPCDDADFGKGVAVMIPGTKATIGCYITELSRTPPPPLPGGYVVGEKVYFTGETYTFRSGYKLTHGQRGEVAGPLPRGDPDFGKGVAVRIPGNEVSDVGCLPTDLSRAPPPPLPAATPPASRSTTPGKARGSPTTSSSRTVRPSRFWGPRRPRPTSARACA